MKLSRRFIPLQILSRRLLKRSIAGFTLLELLLALGILAVVLTGLLAFFVNLLFLNEGNRNLTTAITHAQFIMEEIREAATTDFLNLENRINPPTSEWNLSTDAEFSARNLTRLNSETIVTSFVANPPPPPRNPLEVVVTVFWRDRGLRDRQLELRTLFTNY